MSTKISEMDPAGTLTGAEMIPVVQAGDNVRSSPDQILGAAKVLRPVARVAFLQFEEPGVGALPPATAGDRYAVGFVGSPAGGWGSIAGVAVGDILQYDGSAWAIDWDASAAVAGGAGFLVQVATGSNLTGGGWHGFIGGNWQALVQAPAVYSVNATGSNASGAAFHGGNGLPSSVVVNSTSSGQGVRASSAVGPTTYLNTSANQVELYPSSNSDQFVGLSQGQAVPLAAGGWRTIMTVYRQDIGRNIHITTAQSA